MQDHVCASPHRSSRVTSIWSWPPFSVRCFALLHFFFWRGVPPFFVPEMMNILVFFPILSQFHGVCMGRSGTSVYAAYSLFSHLCYVGSFGDLGDPVLRTLRNVSEEFVTVYAYWDTKECFFFCKL